MRVIILFFACALSGATTAQDLDPRNGQALYDSYCTQCHGTDAMGTGPMSSILNVEIPDLTQISGRNGGTFPIDQVSMQIDGRARLLAHGGDMPVFGPMLDSARQIPMQLPSGQTLMVSQPMAELLAYLASLQSEE